MRNSRGGMDAELFGLEDPGSIAEVPALVRRYLDGALTTGGSIPRQVRVRQVGEMCQKPGGRWLSFTAVEEFAVEEVAFSWRARFPIVPLVWLRVVDRYAAGEGLLEARLWGLLRVMRARGQDASEGEVLRYLAELAWAPQAMLANRQLEWRQLDAQAVEVTTRVASARVTVRLEFDAAGDIVGTWCDARPYLEGKTSVPRPWRPAGSATTRCRRHSDSDPRRGPVGTPGRAVHLLDAERSPRSNSTLQCEERNPTSALWSISPPRHDPDRGHDREPFRRSCTSKHDVVRGVRRSGWKRAAIESTPRRRSALIQSNGHPRLRPSRGSLDQLLARALR